tara:strand:+ start:430 stop:834 length:405 start_codon:yes stop_codon:yes gene_type:complete
MAHNITISEDQLTNVIKKIINEQIGEDEVIVGFDDEDIDFEGEEEEMEDEEEEETQQILTPEEIMGLMEEQIVQLQGRTEYMEELNADMLEFTSYLMQDLEKAEELDLKKSKQKLRALETRAGREIFWLKSRRL